MLIEIFSITFLCLLISFEGVIIFLILVALRKRVLRDMANCEAFPCVKLPEKWRTLHISETMEESDDQQTESNCDENESPLVERSFVNIVGELQWLFYNKD